MSGRQINADSYQGEDRRARQEWHVDKTVSIGHILTTIGVAVTCILFLAEQDKRIAANAKDIEHNAASIEQQESRVNRSLDAISGKLDKLSDLIIEGLTQ